MASSYRGSLRLRSSRSPIPSVGSPRRDALAASYSPRPRSIQPHPRWPAYEEPTIETRSVLSTLEHGLNGPERLADPVWSNPLILRRTDINYPWQARALQEQGVVQLRMRIAVDGSPRDVAVEISSGHPRLDQAALTAVRHWQFKPLMRDGAPVEAWARLPIAFRLAD